MSEPLGKVRRIYDRDPAGYDRSMSSVVSDWMLAGRRRKVGEMVSGRANGVPGAHPQSRLLCVFNLIVGHAPTV